MSKTYKLEDFFAKTNCETSSKMPLKVDGKDTGQYLMVVGSQARSVVRAKIDYGVGIAELNEKLAKIDDKTERSILKIDSEELITNEYAAKLVDGWSFPDFSKGAIENLLSENPAISHAVIAHAHNDSGVIKGK